MPDEPPGTTRPSEDDCKAQIILGVLKSNVALNLLAALVKFAVGWQTGLLNVLADSLHSLMVASINVIGIVSVRLAQRHADDRHPYGYEKYQTIVGLIWGCISFVLLWEVLKGAYERLLHPEAAKFHPIALGVMLIFLALNVFILVRERRVEREVENELLHADTRAIESECYASGAACMALPLIAIGWVWMDAVISLVIGAIVFWNMYRIFRMTAAILTDEAVLDPGEINKVVVQNGVRWCHAIRSRGKKTAMYVDLHIGVDPKISVENAHDVISHRAKIRLQEAFPGIKGLLTHIEPDTDAGRRRDHSVFGVTDDYDFPISRDTAEPLVRQVWEALLSARRSLTAKFRRGQKPGATS